MIVSQDARSRGGGGEQLLRRGELAKRDYEWMAALLVLIRTEQMMSWDTASARHSTKGTPGYGRCRC